MFLLIIAGIGIAASVISWVSGVRTEKVEAQIAALEAQWAAILAADAGERRQLAMAYLVEFRTLVEEELASRNEIATSLAQSLAQAKEILQRKFGSNESDGFLQAVLEIELAFGRLHGERALLQSVLNTLPVSVDDIDLGAALPTPDDLLLPENFPCLGGGLDLSYGMPSVLHGYDIEYVDDSMAAREWDTGMFIAVDHAAQRARVSLQSGALLAANLAEEGRAISAIVQSVRPGYVELDSNGARFALNSLDAAQLGKVRNGARLSVYPERWTFDQLVDRGARQALPVRLRPRIAGTREIWSPIYLALSEEAMPQLVEAYHALEAQGRSHEKWAIQSTSSSQITFSQGEVTLCTSVDLELKSFVLDSVRYGPPETTAAVSLYVELQAFIPGTEDDDLPSRELFPEFINLLTAELTRVRAMHSQRQSALRLRKLSLIYQDQVEYLQMEASCGFLVGEADKHGTTDGTLTLPHVPAWLNAAIASSEPSRLRAVGGGMEWPVSSAEWLDHKMGLLRLKLAQTGRKESRASPFLITRIELAGEGSQQQTFYRTLEHAISGKFLSPAVHHALMTRGTGNTPTKHLGRAAVDALLHSEEPLVAIWGPPGTGKTTMLVDWLLSLFDPAEPSRWPTMLITGPTNIAVTKLVSDLLKRAEHLERELVRYGRAEHVQETALAPMWHKALLEPFDSAAAADIELDPLLQRWHSLLSTREGRESIAKWVLGPRHLHAATCVGMARRDYGLANRSFDIAVVDEAGKAFDAELFLPAARAQRLILVGDHYQLPPTVTDEVLNEDIPYRLPLAEVEELLCKNCFEDLFERLPANCKGMLTMQYRMHRDIGQLVSQLFYEGKLESYRAEPGWGISTHRVNFIDFSDNPAYRHVSSDTQRSPRNATERRALEAMLKRLNDVKTAKGKNILIVCPYKGQREAVEHLVKGMRFNFQLDVTTVDAVQGGEADIVFLLMTRSRGRVEFLLDRNRLNVALSRARDAVYILGHRRCLSPQQAGPVAEMITLGLQLQTLRVVRADGKLDEQQLARAIFIAPEGKRVSPPQKQAKKSAARQL